MLSSLLQTKIRSSRSSSKHQMTITHQEHVHAYFDQTAEDASELPTVMRGLAAVHLGAINILTPFAYQASEYTRGDINSQRQMMSTNNSIASVPLSRSSTIRWALRFFRRNDKNPKDNIDINASPPILSTPAGHEPLINIAAATINGSLITPCPSSSITQSTTITKNAESLRLDIFSTNTACLVSTNDTPTSNARINSTSQLAYCCSILSRANGSSSSAFIVKDLSDIPLTEKEQYWAESMDPIMRNHYHWLIIQLVRAFTSEPVKNHNITAEIVLVGPVLDENSYRGLLSCFINEVESSTLLDLNILQGLIQLVECASSGYLVDNDLVKIAATLSEKLSSTHTGSSNHHLYLIWGLSRIFDVMVEGKVKDLNRNRDHQPMLQLLASFIKSDNLYLRYQSRYAYQALQYIPDDETPLKIVWRYIQEAAKVASATTSILKIDPQEFLEGVATFSRICGEMSDVVVAGIEGGKFIIESAKNLREDLGTAIRAAENTSENIKRRSWYLTLRGTAMFIQQGRFTDFNIIVGNAQCRNNVDFQWGICRQLGEVITDPRWDNFVRQQAIEFLNELYKGSLNLKLHEDVKQWIMIILAQVSYLPNEVLKGSAASILDQLKINYTFESLASYPLITRLPQPISFPLLDKIQEIPKVEYDLHVLRFQRKAEYSQPVYIPPMAKLGLHGLEDPSLLFPLMDKVKEFLANDQQVMLVLGDSGAGKSTFNRHLEHELWKEYNPGDRIPLFIDLPTLNQPKNELIQEHLRGYNFSEAQIQELLKHRQFTLICDSYDESQLKCNLHTTNSLNQSGHRDTKLIITCRSQYLGPDYHNQFAPKALGQYYLTANHLFLECTIASFTKSQIKSYVEQYVALETRKWTKYEYMDKLESIPNLMNLAKNPFLLTLCLEALPNVINEESNVSRIRLTRVQLYDGFVQHWLDVNKRRLQDTRLMDIDRAAFDLLLEDGFERHGRLYQKKLAQSIFREQGGRPIVNYSHLQDENTWKSQFFGPDPKRALLRSSSLLNRTGTQYQFVHRSMLEYFYSCLVCGPNNRHNELDVHPHLPINDHPLSSRNLTTEPSIIQFLSERVHQKTIFKQQLLDIIEHSKIDEQASCAAANAITILVRAEVLFNGHDLRGIRIPGANLRGGQFDSAQLQGADLTGVNFTKSWVRQVDFSNATMTGVHFGELPHLKFDYEVYSCAYSSDGKNFAVGLESGEIFLYDAVSWRQVHTFSGHAGSINSLAFSPSSDILLSGSNDKTVRLWECTTKSIKLVLEGHSKSVTSVAYSPCGNHVASAGKNKDIRLWSTESGAVISVLTGHTKSICSIAYSPDGLNILSASMDRTIRIFDVRTGQAWRVLSCGLAFAFSVTYSPDGLNILSGHSSGGIKLRDPKTGKELRYWSNYQKFVSKAIYSPNGQWIASCGFETSINIWSAHAWRLISTLTGHDKISKDITFSPDGSILASGCQDKTVRLWDLGKLEIGSVKVTYSGRMYSIYSLDQQTIISASSFGGVLIQSTLTGKHERYVASRYFGQTSIAISPDRLRMAAGDSNFNVHITNIESGLIEFVLAGHTQSIEAIAFSPRSDIVATGSRDATVRLWSMDSGDIVRELDSHAGVKALEFSPDGQQIASVSQDDAVILWEVETGEMKEFYAKKNAQHSFTHVGFSPISAQITACDSKNNHIIIWIPSSNEPRHILKHDGSVNTFVWSCCEQWIVTYHPNSAWVWKKSSEKAIDWTCVTVIRGLYEPFNNIEWRPNALEFVTGCSKGAVRVWRLVEKMGVWSVQLVWSTQSDVLVASETQLSNVIGLSALNQQLLEQRKSG